MVVVLPYMREGNKKGREVWSRQNENEREIRDKRGRDKKIREGRDKKISERRDKHGKKTKEIKISEVDG